VDGLRSERCRVRSKNHGLINIRTICEPTPEGRLAAVARDEMFRQLDAKRLPDYADFRCALEQQVKIEILQARLDEARLKPNHARREKELLGQLASVSL